MHQAVTVVRAFALSAGITSLTATTLYAADLAPTKPVKAYRVPAISYQERIPPAYVCRPGWWQTLSWGKVRPRYHVRCYYQVAQR